jgi:hypothetical protein
MEWPPRSWSHGPEKKRRNEWDQQQQELLCVLYRFYHCEDKFDLSRIWCAITGLDVKLSIVRGRFKDHIWLYGVNAYPEFERVFYSTPLDDPLGKYGMSPWL